MKKNYNGKPLGVFLSYFKPHMKLFVIDMLCAFAVSIIDLIFPIISRRSMQSYLPDKLFSAFFIVIAVLLAAYLLKAVFY